MEIFDHIIILRDSSYSRITTRAISILACLDSHLAGGLTYDETTHLFKLVITF